MLATDLYIHVYYPYYNLPLLYCYRKRKDTCSMTSPSSLALWLGIKEVAGDIGLPSSLSRCSDNLSRFFSRIFWPRRGEGEDKRLSKYLPQSLIDDRLYSFPVLFVLWLLLFDWLARCRHQPSATRSLRGCLKRGEEIDRD